MRPSLAAIAADALLAVHAGVVAFVVLGAVAILVGRWRGWRWVRARRWRLLHAAMVAVIALQAWLGRLCPLTVWEQALRAHAGQPAHSVSFIEYWLSRLIFFEAPWWAFVAAYSGFAGLVALLWVTVPPRR